MKKFVTLALFALIFTGCKKAQEQIQYNLIMQIITTGQWKVTSFDKGGVDVSSDFAPYAFQFRSDFTVDAIKNATVEITGTWDADRNGGNMSSQFTNAPNPIYLLNGDWHITDNSPVYVEANQTVNGEFRKLRLDRL